MSTYCGLLFQKLHNTLFETCIQLSLLSYYPYHLFGIVSELRQRQWTSQN